MRILAVALLLVACGDRKDGPLVAPAKPKGPLRPGCVIDTPVAAWCMPSISYAYRDLAEAVGSPKLLRQRVAAAGVRRCEITEDQKVVVTLEFDERGNLVASRDENPKHPQRAEATWVEDRLATTKSTWMGGVTETLSSVGDSDCRYERTWGRGKAELHECWSDGSVVASSESIDAGPWRMTLARATSDSIAYPKGYRQEWDGEGRIVRTVTGDGVERRTVYEASATRIGTTTWSIDARGLPSARRGDRRAQLTWK
jgi:YD repeat-containing protein